MTPSTRQSEPARPPAGDLSAPTAYADSERETKASPTLLDDWMPAFLAQLAAPGAHLVRAARSDGTPLLHLFAPDREPFAEFIARDGRWTVRQGGPVPLWDRIEEALVAWEAAGNPRPIQRWNGYAWEAHGFAANLAEAKRIQYPDSKIEPPAQEPGPAPRPLGPGIGRHRKPQASGPERR